MLPLKSEVLAHAPMTLHPPDMAVLFGGNEGWEKPVGAHGRDFAQVHAQFFIVLIFVVVLLGSCYFAGKEVSAGLRVFR